MYLINLIGGSGSGKGYLAEKIIETFGKDKVDTIPYDMYYYPADRFPAGLEVEFEGKKFKNFDTPEALETELLIKHIEMLKNGQEIQIPEYDFGNNPTGQSQRKPGKIIKPVDFIILDGLFGLHNPRLRELSDVSIFIELSSVNRMARRFMRDFGNGTKRAHAGENGIADDILFYITFVQAGYRKFVEPTKQFADLVVDNNEWIHEGQEPKMIDIVINYLKGKFDFQKNSIV